MDRQLDRPDVDPAREPEVGVQEVAVPVFLGRSTPAASEPMECPDARGGPTICSSEMVVGQGFFRDHVPDEDDQEVVGHTARISRNRPSRSDQSSAVSSGR